MSLFTDKRSDLFINTVSDKRTEFHSHKPTRVKVRPPESQYEEEKKEFIKELSYGIVMVARLKPRNYFIRKGQNVQLIDKISIKQLTRHSYLFEDGARGDDLSSELFRTQFYCLLMTYIIECLDDIVIGYLRTMKGISALSAKQKLICLRELKDDINCFTSSFFTNDDYRDSLYELYSFLTLRNLKNHRQTKKSTVTNILDILGVFSAVYLSNGIMINELFRTAYIMSTNDTKHVPLSFVDVECDVFEPEEIEKVIRRLGTIILKEWKRRNNRPMFTDIFMCCAPISYVKFPKVKDDLELNYGCRALMLVDLMVRSPKIHKLIQKMVVY